MKLTLRRALTLTLWVFVVFSFLTISVSCSTKKTASTEPSSTSQESWASSAPRVLEFYADW